MNKILLGNDVNCSFDNGIILLTDKGANIIRLDVGAYEKLEHFVSAQIRAWEEVKSRRETPETKAA